MKEKDKMSTVSYFGWKNLCALSKETLTFCSKVDFLCKIIIVMHGMFPDNIPITIAAHDCTSPARYSHTPRINCQHKLHPHMFINEWI